MDELSRFHRREVVLWTTDKKRYAGTLEVPSKGGFILISQDGNPCEIAAILRVEDVIKIELRRKRNFYAGRD